MTQRQHFKHKRYYDDQLQPAIIQIADLLIDFHTIRLNNECTGEKVKGCRDILHILRSIFEEQSGLNYKLTNRPQWEIMHYLATLKAELY